MVHHKKTPISNRGPFIAHGKKDIVGERGLLKTAFPMNVLQCCCSVSPQSCVLATLVVSKVVTMISQCFVVCCSVLQCVAECCSELQATLVVSKVVTMVWPCFVASALKCIVVCCSVLQRVAVCDTRTVSWLLHWCWRWWR